MSFDNVEVGGDVAIDSTMVDARAAQTVITGDGNIQIICSYNGIPGGPLVPAAPIDTPGQVRHLGQPVTSDLDPFDLGVHKAIAAETNPGTTETLTVYVPRDHDRRLREIVATAVSGHSAMVVLLGDSSTGKTRALWEALAPLREHGGWRLWHPRSPNRRTELTLLGRVQPRTVVWLNETQEYLGRDDRTGEEETAVALQDLLRDPRRAPVLVVGTLWHTYYTEMCRPHASQVRELLESATTTVLTVPPSFEGADPSDLDAAATTDPRLMLARERAENGRITQYLAGGPELVRRYERELSPAAKAIVQVAMDARRMGHRNRISRDLLEQAAAAYMSKLDWDELDDEWLEQALGETGQRCKGARGPVTRTRPSPSTTASRHRKAGATEHHNPERPVYQLADYLDQYGRSHRTEHIPAVGFWEAALLHGNPDDLAAIGFAAFDHGMYRYAAQLWKSAVRDHENLSDVDLRGARALVEMLYALHPDDHRPSAWLAATVDTVDCGELARTVKVLHQTGALTEATAVATLAAERAEGSWAAPLTRLLCALHEVGAQNQAVRLAARTAARITFDYDDYPMGVAQLLRTLRRIGADGAFETLTTRILEHELPDDLFCVGDVLEVLIESGAHTLAVAIADMAADQAGPDSAFGVNECLPILRRLGAEAAFDRMATHAADGVEISDTDITVELLRTLRSANRGDLAARLATRAAHQADLTYLDSAGDLLRELRELGSDDCVHRVIARATDQTVLELIHGADRASSKMREEGAIWSANENAHRYGLLHWHGLTNFLARLGEIQGNPQATALANRVLACAFDGPHSLSRLLLALLHDNCEEEARGVAAVTTHGVRLDQPYGIADLLLALREIRAHDEFAILAERAVNGVRLEHPKSTADILTVLHETGMQQHHAALARTVACQLPLDDPVAVANLLRVLCDTGADADADSLAQRAATQIVVDDSYKLTGLLDALRHVRAHEPLVVFVQRLTAAGMFGLISAIDEYRQLYRFGREFDGTPTPPWAWEDLS